MFEQNLLRKNIEFVVEQLAKRGFEFDPTEYQSLNTQRKTLQVEVNDAEQQRNEASKAIGQLKAKGESADELVKQMKTHGDTLKTKQNELNELLEQIKAIELSLPNIPHDTVPIGKNETDNPVVRTWGTPKSFSFEPLDHVSLGERHACMDFNAAAKISGSRFVVLHQQFARLHRALGQFMLDFHIQQHGFQEVYVPYLVNRKAFYGTGQLPKFSEDQFMIEGEWDLGLIPTAEVPVTNLYADTIVEEGHLPVKHVTQTPCFRSEAGSYGQDTRGMIRQHQFEKVEMVCLTRAENSYLMLEDIVQHAEAILQALELPYQVIELCSGDLGFSAAKTYDLEVWIPTQNAYREISSCSNFESFQARRMKARWRGPGQNKPQLLHTLNGSGLPLGRTLVALLENNQDEAGNISIPRALQPYMNGASLLKVNA